MNAPNTPWFNLSAKARRRRWSDDNKHLGPFTLCRGDFSRWGFMLNSGGCHESSRNKGCHLRLHIGTTTLIVELPRLLPDYRIRHVPESWDAATVARLGRNWYDEVFPREFGAYAADDAMHIHFGPQTFDSTTTRSKVVWIPWKQWRFIRHSWFGPTGQHIETLWETRDRTVRDAQWEWRREFEASLVKTRFVIEDSDGARITAATHIEEREWRLGTGLFAWLSLFRKPMVRRSLAIEFDKEVGPDKGSWKGGLIGTSIEMLPGELHEAAFRRYCEQEHRSKYAAYRVKFMESSDHA